MKFTKFLVLAGGVLGLIAFFLPLIAVKDSGVKGSISAFQVVKGIDSAQDVIDNADTAQFDASGEGKKFKKDANEALSEVKGIFLAIFAPALFLAIIGGVATMRKKFGRLGGAGALIFGGIGLGIWAILNTAANEVAAEGGSGDVKGIGMWVLLVTGLAGLIGGILTLVKPDRGPASA
jgi:hypothetical protein